MSLVITRISVRDFRSYENMVLEPDEAVTVIAGPNASGKTNLVEAIQLTTEAASFRRPQWADVVRWGSDSASVELQASDGDRRHDVLLNISRDGRRTYRVNGKTRRSVSDVAGIIPCVIFTPEDLRIIKDSAERRREAVDTLGAQLSKTYSRLKSEYERVVRQRNSLLRNGLVSDDSLAPWDERLVALGARLMRHRVSLFGKIAAEAEEMYGRMATDGPLTARYVPSWERDGAGAQEGDEARAIETHLARRRDDERARGVSLAGPHRDDIVFELQGHDARACASQGQQRSIALALKLAEVRVVAAVSGSRPVLLLDDVMSELDSARREALTVLVGDTAQTIITTTTLAYFSDALLSDAKVVKLA